LQPNSAECEVDEQLEESFTSNEEGNNSTIVDAGQNLNQVNCTKIVLYGSYFLKGLSGSSVQTSIPSNVPDYLEGWEEDFSVPTQFSERTMGVLSSGLMSKSARAEIVQATTAKMLNFCKYPTAQQYNIVAKKIVNSLLNGKKDSTGTGFVSRMLFKVFSTYDSMAGIMGKGFGNSVPQHSTQATFFFYWT